MLHRWSFRYWAFRKYVNFAYWIFHRKIVIRGEENIPSGKPVVYAPNHQNALSDPLALVFAVPHQTVWLARADIFRFALARPFLRFLKIIPVYRIRDGKETLTENEKTFDNCIRILKNNQALGLFPEAAHSGKRQMLPHKKAVSRIVFLAEEKTGFSLDIQIVPVGIFYDQYHNFGRKLMVNFGKPLSALNYREKYHQNPHAAAVALKDDLQEAIRSLILNFETKNNYEGFEAVCAICGRNHSSVNPFSDSFPEQMEQTKKLAGTLDSLEITNPELANSIAGDALDLEKIIRSSGLRCWLVDEKEENRGKLILRILLLILTSPLYLYGLLFNGLPFVFLDNLVRKKVKEAVFRSTFSFALGLLLFPAVYLIEFLIVYPFLPGMLLRLLFILSLPFAGKFAHLWHIYFLKAQGQVRWLKIKQKDPDLYNKIHSRKQEILNQVMNNQ